MNKHSVRVVCMFSSFLFVVLHGIAEKHIDRDYLGKIPQEWGEVVSGVKTSLDTDQKVVALTLDLCGSPTDGLDYRYVRFFMQEQIPVTIFVSGRWIDLHGYDFYALKNNPLFAIENHGLNHKPCSVDGKSAWGIAGTANLKELYQEVENNGKKIESFTKKKPKFFRSGTAYYDEVAVEFINRLGYTVVGFNVLGDKGATYTKEEAYQAVIAAQSGSIIILHMNRPNSVSTEGALAAIKDLKERGFRFVKLEEYPLK